MTTGPTDRSCSNTTPNRSTRVSAGHTLFSAIRVPHIFGSPAWVAHPQVRNRGTIGGAVAQSDLAAEFPAAPRSTSSAVATGSVARFARVCPRQGQPHAWRRGWLR
ncbi:hypothetical protein FGL98_24385 [Leekyejoonella antrihumi]|uniref:Uncharacterized protein n=1 Tax=Leekyejoonella antrihumi TaxID=1660198 RepID=A0A563DQ35_9MICO|nr:hypothetical protein FGL98_24385 [Leekyejoonella antrihumi]